MAKNVNLPNIIAGLATAAVINASADPANAITRADAPTIAEAIKAEVAADPRLSTIAEAVTPVSWYHDRIFVTSLVGVIAAVLSAVWGIQLTPEHQAIIVNVAPSIISGVAGVAIMVFRVFSRVKPITK